MRIKKGELTVFLLPYMLLFSIFIVIPIVIAIGLSFTNFNAVQQPKWVGLLNYINLFTSDDIFLKNVLPNTLVYAVVVGPGGYVLAFVLAWLLSQITRGPRTILALIIYSPSMTLGVAMNVVWRVLFLGNQSGFINYLLMKIGVITEPIVWLTNSQYLLPIVILVALWSSMGVGFLAMLSGILNVSSELFEAAAIDGVSNRFQEIVYVTIPAMKPQMLFGAVMSIVNAFQTGNIGTMLSGSNPTPQYAAQMIINHVEDYGFVRYEMGYAAAVSVVLLLMIWAFTRIAKKLFG